MGTTDVEAVAASSRVGPDEDALERGIRIAGLVCWTLVLLAALLGLVLAQLAHPTAIAPGLALVCGHELLVLHSLLRRKWSKRWVALIALPFFLGVLQVMPYRSQIDPINLWAPGYWGLPWVALVIIAFPRRAYLTISMACFGLLAVTDVVVQWAVGAPLDRFALEPVPGHLSPVVMLVLFCDGLLEIARRADRSAAQRDAAEAEHGAQVARAQERAESTRLLHDTVLHALHALSSLGGRVPEELVVDECRTAADALEGRGWQDLSATPPETSQMELPAPSADVLRDVRRALTRTAWPNLALAPVFTLLLHPLVSPVWPVVLGTCLLLLVGVWQIRRLNERPMGGWDALVMVAVSLTVWATNLWTAPDQITMVHYVWLCWGCAALAHLVVLQARFRTGVLGLLAWGLAMSALMVARYGTGVDWVRLHPVVSVGLGEGLVTIVAFHSGRRMAERDAQQRIRERMVRVETERVQARTEVEERWSRTATAMALPLLAEVASRRTDLRDPALPARAALVEATLRDQLVLGPRHGALLEGLSRLREEGWAVASSLEPDAGQPVLDLAGILVDGLGLPAFPGQRATVSAAAGRASAVVLDPTPDQLALWRQAFPKVTADDGFARILMVSGGLA